MKMIVGLGNPGKKYDETRHNVGFEFIGELARRWQAGGFREKHQALITESNRSGEKVLLVAPQTFMNLSGVAVRQVLNFYKIEPEDVLVACDDFNLPLGKLRLRAKGSAGGQNGLANILLQLGTQDVPRLRIGIGPVPERWNTVDFVLGKFSRDEQDLATKSVKLAADAAERWLAEGLGPAMNQYN